MKISLPESKFNELGYRVAERCLDGSVRLIPMVSLEDELFEVLKSIETALDLVINYAGNSEVKYHFSNSLEHFRRGLKALDINALEATINRLKQEL